MCTEGQFKCFNIICTPLNWGLNNQRNDHLENWLCLWNSGSKILWIKYLLVGKEKIKYLLSIIGKKNPLTWTCHAISVSSSREVPLTPENQEEICPSLAYVVNLVNFLKENADLWRNVSVSNRGEKKRQKKERKKKKT